jgi:glycerophosphoryl diester phosphodiesterase
MDLPAAELVKLAADFEGPACADAHIPLLSELRDLLDRSPHITAFVELKAESLLRFGIQRMVDKTVETLNGAYFPWIIISFEKEALEYASRQHHVPVGWVLHKHDTRSLDQARILSPAYLFCNVEKLPPGRLESGPWSWVIYDVNDWDSIEALIQRGACLVETSRISALAELKQKSGT